MAQRAANHRSRPLRLRSGATRTRAGAYPSPTHPESEEILYFIKGKGLQTVGDEERECCEGGLVRIPKAVYHSTINTGEGELVIFAVYSPHGPEAFLRALPECEIVPPKNG